MTKKLHNSLIDFLVVAGFDEFTGLVPENDLENKVLSKKNNYADIEKKEATTLCICFKLLNDDIFSVKYQIEILANITSDIATYPKRNIKFNMFYPQINYTRASVIFFGFFLL
jgi:hypothetical protein